MLARLTWRRRMSGARRPWEPARRTRRRRKRRHRAASRCSSPQVSFAVFSHTKEPPQRRLFCIEGIVKGCRGVLSTEIGISMKVLLLALLFGAFGCSAEAQDLAITDAKIYVSPRAQPEGQTTILIRAGKIAAVGRHLVIPEGIASVACEGCVV